MKTIKVYALEKLFDGYWRISKLTLNKDEAEDWATQPYNQASMHHLTIPQEIKAQRDY